ncbi:hypothetical protein RJ639_013467 [Escallonia herrerae]|uniref:Uncharacterized protein n=1 Tax=Escallonia herrerae TaxID=1293975 RepID=A0AA88VGK2_9ASTE|nr:hypothetical protein RJ639_013467 [Escallonia herrerae]
MSESIREAIIGETEVNTIFKRRERKKTSLLWDFFDDVNLANGTKKVKCKLHNAILNKTKGATTNQSVINVKLGKMEYEVSKKDLQVQSCKC